MGSRAKPEVYIENEARVSRSEQGCARVERRGEEQTEDSVTWKRRGFLYYWKVSLARGSGDWDEWQSGKDNGEQSRQSKDNGSKREHKGSDVETVTDQTGRDEENLLKPLEEETVRDIDWQGDGTRNKGYTTRERESKCETRDIR